MEIKISNISKSYENEGSIKKVLENASIFVESGDFVSIIGPSGCGKTTLLQSIGGFLDDKKPSKEIFMIFQDFNQLFPWRTLGDNIYYAIRKTHKGLSKEEIRKRVQKALLDVGLSEFYDYFPHQLSGGMKQRGALARALAVESRVILMDEPFSSLDMESRRSAHQLLLKIWKEKKLTIIFVTHDLEEAKFLSNKIIDFKDINGEISI